MSIVMGVDLGFVTSSTAISVLDQNEYSDFTKMFKIQRILKINPFLYYNGDKRLAKIVSRRLIAEAIGILFAEECVDKITIEEPYLQGEGNKLFLKFFGLIEDKILHPLLLAPLSVKSYLGSGKLDKRELAEACKKYFNNKKDINLINRAIKREDWDVTDSIAIAIAGVLHENK